MSKRNIEIKVRLNRKEAEILNKRVKKSRLSREAYLRHLIDGVVPQDSPPPDYYSMMRELHGVANNSEFIIMLNQAASDREKLAKLLNISKEQMSYVTNADAGCGLIKYGSALVPFVNRWPRQTKLYDLMTTRPGEGVFGGEKQEVQE